MSTTFGIVIKNGKLLDLPPREDGLIPGLQDIKDEDNVEIVSVAFRSSRGILWKNPLAPFLPPETKVYPLDNTHQGIFTIGDIIEKLKT